MIEALLTLIVVLLALILGVQVFGRRTMRVVLRQIFSWGVLAVAVGIAFINWPQEHNPFTELYTFFATPGPHHPLSVAALVCGGILVLPFYAVGAFLPDALRDWVARSPRLQAGLRIAEWGLVALIVTIVLVTAGYLAFDAFLHRH